MRLNKAQFKLLNTLLLTDSSGTLLPNYFYKHGGYAVGDLETELTVRNNTDMPIRIVDIRAAKTCTKPIGGTLFWAPGQSAIGSIVLGFNLDLTSTDAKVTRGYPPKSTTPDYFPQYTVAIKPGMIQVFDMLASSGKYSCEFKYFFSILEGNKQVSELIGQGSGSFRVSALPSNHGISHYLAKYNVVYVGGTSSNVRGGRWVRVNPRTYG